MYLVTARWFGMRIDFLSAVFLGAVAFGSIPLASGKILYTVVHTILLTRIKHFLRNG